MAKVTIVINDADEDSVECRFESDPAIDMETTGTNAQNLGMHLMDVLTKLLKAEGEQNGN